MSLRARENNGALFSLALKLIGDGRGVKLLGADIGPGLVKLLKSFGDETLPAAQLHEAIDAWRAKQEKKTRSLAGLVDRTECLHIFADQAPNLGGAIAYAEMLFKQDGTIQLMSGHKSKGLEFDVVYHLDPWRVPSPWVEPDTEAFEQERNVHYVITTRAKRELHHVNLEDYRGG